MLALLSPAKTLDFKRPLPPLAATEPRFAEEAVLLAAAAAKLPRNKLAALMHISDPLAALNTGRYRGFMEQEERPAIYAFAGDVYAGFDLRSLDANAVRFAQDHVRILSGLYGILRPLDRIRPYRLEMGTRWAPRRKSLYDCGAPVRPTLWRRSWRPPAARRSSIWQARNIGACLSPI